MCLPCCRVPRRPRQQTCYSRSSDPTTSRQSQLHHAGEDARRRQAGDPRQGYRLGIETNKDTPAFPPRTSALTVVQPGQAHGATLGPNKTTYNDDIIAGWVGVGSQLDGLGHIGIDNLYYNCNKAADFGKTDGLNKLGIENVPAIATRGVLLDMAGFFRADIVKEGTAFNRAEIEGAMKRQGVRASRRATWCCSTPAGRS